MHTPIHTVIHTDANVLLPLWFGIGGEHWDNMHPGVCLGQTTLFNSAHEINAHFAYVQGGCQKWRENVFIL